MPFTLTSVTIVLAYIWWIAPVAPRPTRFVPVVLVLALTVWRAIRTGEWGARPAAFLPALGWSAAFTAVAAAAIYLGGVRLGTLAGAPEAADLRLRLLLLIPWALAQQLALHVVLLRESEQALSRRGGIGLAALLFGILHLPNPFLAPVTAIAALAWCWIYDRHPNLIPMALSHAVLTVVVLYALNDAVTLRVGAAYWN
jgi:membrane protease YdiL (CAAX protease family)